MGKRDICQCGTCITCSNRERKRKQRGNEVKERDGQLKQDPLQSAKLNLPSKVHIRNNHYTEVKMLQEQRKMLKKEVEKWEEKVDEMEKAKEHLLEQVEEEEARFKNLEKNLAQTSQQLQDARRKAKEESEQVAKLEEMKKRQMKDFEEMQHRMEEAGWLEIFNHHLQFLFIFDYLR